MKEYYKIGEISKLYNIGTDSLRYYEEVGILKPKRSERLQDVQHQRYTNAQHIEGASLDRVFRR